MVSCVRGAKANFQNDGRLNPGEVFDPSEVGWKLCERLEVVGPTGVRDPSCFPSWSLVEMLVEEGVAMRCC